MIKIARLIKNHKGFTLVELMVVVVILGILAAIAVPLYNSQTETARLNAHMSNIRIIESSIQQAEATGTAAADIDASSTDAGPLAGYIQTWPTAPGTYTVENGVLTASPTKEDTQAAIDGGDAVTWPE